MVKTVHDFIIMRDHDHSSLMLGGDFYEADRISRSGWLRSQKRAAVELVGENDQSVDYARPARAMAVGLSFATGELLMSVASLRCSTCR